MSVSFVNEAILLSFGIPDINGGEKICIRLRPHFDKGAFMPEHDIIGTMLHEVSYQAD